MLTTPFIYRFDSSDYYIKIFFDGDSKTFIYNIIVEGSDSNFPNATTIMSIIGIVIILVGVLYTLALAITKNDCLLTKRKAPGPITGTFFLVGGLLGLIGLLVLVPHASDLFEANSNYDYGFGYIFTLIIVSLFILVGLFLLILTFTNADKKRTKKKR
jgi:hypothetical protein